METHAVICECIHGRILQSAVAILVIIIAFKLVKINYDMIILCLSMLTIFQLAILTSVCTMISVYAN